MHAGFIHVIELLGTFSFAAAGSFAAMEKKLDPFGVLIIAFVTAIGGGTIRDILIGDLPVTWLTNMEAVMVIIGAAALSLFFGAYLQKLNRLLFLFDALGLGLFTLIGIQNGIDHQLSPGICVALGTITGCFGGVLRDVLLNNVPLIFQKEIYASASLIGGAAYFLFLAMPMDDHLANVMSIAIIFMIRLLAVRFHWSLPKFYERN